MNGQALLGERVDDRERSKRPSIEKAVLHETRSLLRGPQHRLCPQGFEQSPAVLEIADVVLGKDKAAVGGEGPEKMTRKPVTRRYSSTSWAKRRRSSDLCFAVRGDMASA